MTRTDYTSTGGGLKLKGVKSGGIEKHKKPKNKKKPRDSEIGSANAAKISTSSDGRSRNVPNDIEPGDLNPGEATKETAAAEARADEVKEISMELRKAEEAQQRARGNYEGKTEAERRHEEMRRRRLSERLAREGVKTHKERVEELNKYLSNLSEHHDMPRIGPG